jgi:hypothetical protein
VNLPVAAHDPAAAVDQYRRVEALARGRQFSETEVEADAVFAGLVEQWLGGGIGHRSFEIPVDLLLVPHPVAGKERGQGEFRKDDEGRAPGMRLSQQVEQARDRRFAGIGAMDRPELGNRHGKGSFHAGRIPCVGRWADRADEWTDAWTGSLEALWTGQDNWWTSGQRRWQIGWTGRWTR